jgi:LacI family transcriptional regulator
MLDLGYIYNRNAASLRHPQSRIVGMVISNLSNPFFADFAIAIESALQAAGYIPFIANTAESVLREALVVRSMREHGASGIILCPTMETVGEDVNSLAKLGIPIILAIRRIAGAQVSLVMSNNREGSAEAARHLLSLGHRRIAYIGGMNQMGVRQDRLAGFAYALEDAGVPVEQALIVECPPTRDEGSNAMSALLALSERPTAVLCFNDVVAIGAMSTLMQHGLTPGKDVAVIGFDNTSEARYVSPALTTVDVAVNDLGVRTTQMLLRQIANGSSTLETFVGEAHVVVRESCGSPKRVGKWSVERDGAQNRVDVSDIQAKAMLLDIVR